MIFSSIIFFAKRLVVVFKALVLIVAANLCFNIIQISIISSNIPSIFLSWSKPLLNFCPLYAPMLLPKTALFHPHPSPLAASPLVKLSPPLMLSLSLLLELVMDEQGGEPDIFGNLDNHKYPSNMFHSFWSRYVYSNSIFVVVRIYIATAILKMLTSMVPLGFDTSTTCNALWNFYMWGKTLLCKYR